VRVLLQRVARAQVAVAGETVGEIGAGLLALVGISPRDDDTVVRSLADKTAKLRIFDDELGRMNRSVQEGMGAVLVVSQFTLYGDTSRGNRPGFGTAAPPERAEPLYLTFGERLRERGLEVAFGRFGAAMQVDLVNDGPVTIWLDSEAR
jgi:D-tyrosyl-tRNA(Tyr) deacylase